MAYEPRPTPSPRRSHHRRLVHAYDQCRAKVDWKSGAHHACAEIRASSLSGECDLSQEINRGVFGLMAHHGKCVKRRAALSLALAGRAEPEATVDAVFDRCYADTAPVSYTHLTLPTTPYV